jgi:hypothetical protein
MFHLDLIEPEAASARSSVSVTSLFMPVHSFQAMM